MMILRLKKWPLTSISGVLVIMCYCVFTIISWAFYPDPFSPLTHYLSRLGNFNYSPFGAFFYNIGCILTGVALIPFFMGLYKWYTDRWLPKILLVPAQALGLASAIALIMIGVFSEEKGSPHMTASSTFFLLNFFVLLMVGVALLFHPQFLKLIALYGLTMNFSSLVFAFTVHSPLIEWYTVFGSLVYVGLLSFNTIKLRTD
jgi:hypothetical membrane protein